MARPRIAWSDSQLRLMMTAIEQCDRRYPHDNARFLDAVIDEIRVVTGRLYGVGTYARLLRGTGDSTGVVRRPGNFTIQKAIERARPVPAAPSQGEPGIDAVPDTPSLRRAVEPLLRDTLAPLHELLVQLCNRTATAGTPFDTNDPRIQLELTQAALKDAHARAGRLEEDNAGLRRELARAETQVEIAGTRTAQLLDELHRTIAASTAGADALTQAAKRLEGTEKFLKAQNDAVRLQATAEADGLRRVVAQLRDQISHLQIDRDQYRRALSSNREDGSPDGRPGPGSPSIQRALPDGTKS